MPRIWFLHALAQRSTCLAGAARVLAVVCAWLLLPTRAEAQLSTASITGTVRDSTNAVLPGVTVVLRNLETGVERATVTNDAGNYVFVSLVHSHRI